MERASRGEVTLPPEAVLEFAKSCKDAVTVQLNKEKSYKIRMSGLGRPVCQQLLEKRGIEQETKYNLLFTFLFLAISAATFLYVGDNNSHPLYLLFAITTVKNFYLLNVGKS